MTPQQDAQLHGIEALPGQGRYAMTFRRPDGSEQAAVVQLADSGFTVAESSLPVGWTLAGDTTRAALDAVAALHTARAAGAGTAPALRDVDGGWDVGLGNVVLDAAGVPTCTAHAELVETGGVWECPECGARALLS